MGKREKPIDKKKEQIPKCPGCGKIFLICECDNDLRKA
jgi:hypothetical protein